MNFDTIEIKPTIDCGWESIHSKLEGGRLGSKKYTPSALGFFHYPRKWGVEKGFDLLKSGMIKRHEEEIMRLQESLDLLRLVSPPKPYADAKEKKSISANDQTHL